ncbi:MAG: hypothetical protein ABSE96_17960 [Terracidiphilus sp.]|jgi:hypothetical protein
MNRELALKIALALVGLLFIALVYPMVVFMRQAPVRHTGRLSAFSHPQSIGESQRDCLYRMVEFRSCCIYGHPGISQHGRTRRTDRSGCSYDHQCRPNRTRAIEAVSGVGVPREPLDGWSPKAG